MKLVLQMSVGLLCLCALGFSSTGFAAQRGTDTAVGGRKIRTRDELLAAVNAWMAKYHQSDWTMDELVGRSVDQAYSVFLYYGDNPLDIPVESFLASLVKDQPFTHEIRLRTDWRKEYQLSTAKGELIRQRFEWNKVVTGQMLITKMGSARVDHLRRLPLPPHYTLSLDIIATPAEVQDEKANPSKLTHWGIFLASALVEKKQQPPKTLPAGKGEVAGFVATPERLVDTVNIWTKSLHQPEITRDEITARVADEMFARRDAKRSLEEENLELFLECLAKDIQFVYPMRIDTEGPIHSNEPDYHRLLSINEVLPLPPRYKIRLDILSAPMGIRDPEGTNIKISAVKIVLSYAFPAKDEKAKP